MSTERIRDTTTRFPLNENLIAELFTAESELSDQQGRLISAMSLRNILKTQYHNLTTARIRRRRRFRVEDDNGNEGFHGAEDEESFSKIMTQSQPGRWQGVNLRSGRHQGQTGATQTATNIRIPTISYWEKG